MTTAAFLPQRTTSKCAIIPAALCLALDRCQESEDVDFKESADWETLMWGITHSALGMGPPGSPKTFLEDSALVETAMARQV